MMRLRKVLTAFVQSAYRMYEIRGSKVVGPAGILRPGSPEVPDGGCGNIFIASSIKGRK